MTTSAKIGYGTLFQILTSTGPNVWTSVAEVTSITPPGLSRDTVDATHSESADKFREFIPGLIDGGEVSLELNFVPGNSTTTLLLAEIEQAAARSYKIVFPGGETFSFSGIATAFEPDAPVDDKMSASATFKITGKPVLAAAAAPVNSILPAISGLLTEGATLTAYPGNWSGAPTFTYQWKNAGSNISGATSQTYVIVAGDSGDAITVAVTGTNAAGNATATSAAVTAA